MPDLHIRGYAARFGELSHDLGGFKEKIERGAFADSLKSGENITLLHSHDPSRPLASTRSGSLRLHEDAQGLRFEADILDHGTGGEVARLVKRGDLSGMSFGFQVESASDEDFQRTSNGLIRSLKRVHLIELSTVTWPAYPTTSVTARSLAGDLAEREAALQAARQRDLRRRRIQTAQAAVRAAQRPPEPPPEPVEAIRARARRKRIEHARRFGTTV